MNNTLSQRKRITQYNQHVMKQTYKTLYLTMYYNICIIIFLFPLNILLATYSQSPPSLHLTTLLDTNRHFKKIQDFDEDFYRGFNLVIAGLDSIEARRWINGLLVSILKREVGEVEE